MQLPGASLACMACTLVLNKQGVTASPQRQRYAIARLRGGDTDETDGAIREPQRWAPAWA